MVARHQTASRLACQKAVSTPLILLRPSTLTTPTNSGATAPRASRRPTLLRRLDRKPSTPVLPAFPPPATCPTTNVPELYPSTSKHLPPPSTFAKHPKLDSCRRTTLRGACGPPADRVCRPRRCRWRYAERAGTFGAALAARCGRGVEDGVVRWGSCGAHEL